MKRIILLGILLGALVIATVAQANPLSFIQSNKTATSTLTSVNPSSSYSLTYDSYSADNPYAPDKLVLLSLVTASGSDSSIGIKIQRSMDGVEWFTDTVPATVSTTSEPVLLLADNSYKFNGNTTASTTKYSVEVTPLTRYTKAVFSSISATSSVWATFVAQKQTN